MQPAYELSISRRTRSTPYTNRITAAGVKAYTVYNHMLLATVFDNIVEDYHHLKKHVQVWDIACERQIEVRGTDAARLIQMLTPRDMRAMTPGRCYYTPMVDETGGMLNDPVTIKLDDDRFWVSIADSDLLFWIKGIAYGLRLEVDVREADIWPLAVQGPKADDLVARIFGPYAREIRFFRGTMMPFHGVDLFVARSGYSKQGGYEIYVQGTEIAEPLWDALFEAGEDLNVRVGSPNLIERIEGGLLSYGSDMTRLRTPRTNAASTASARLSKRLVASVATRCCASAGKARYVRSAHLPSTAMRFRPASMLGRSSPMAKPSAVSRRPRGRRISKPTSRSA